jgi:hypothetical protein
MIAKKIKQPNIIKYNKKLISCIDKNIMKLNTVARAPIRFESYFFFIIYIYIYSMRVSFRVIRKACMLPPTTTFNISTSGSLSFSNVGRLWSVRQ